MLVKLDAKFRLDLKNTAQFRLNRREKSSVTQQIFSTSHAVRVYNIFICKNKNKLLNGDNCPIFSSVLFNFVNSIR